MSELPAASNTSSPTEADRKDGYWDPLRPEWRSGVLILGIMLLLGGLVRLWASDFTRFKELVFSLLFLWAGFQKPKWRSLKPEVEDKLQA